MLRINLIPETKRSKVSNIEKEGLFFIMSILILVGVLFFVQNQLNSKITNLKRSVRQKQKINNRLKNKVKKVAQIEEQLEAVKKKIEIIKEIRDKQSLPVKIIDQLVAKIPEDSLWYENFFMDSGQDIDLQGIAMDNQVFATYLQALRNSGYIRDIRLKRTSRHNFQNLKLIEFQCQIQTNSLKNLEFSNVKRSTGQKN